MDRNSFWKIVLILGIILSLVAFILGWIGFGVPDWQAFQRFNGSIVEFYGLWAYCQEQGASLGTVCRRWTTAKNQLFNGQTPNFIQTSEGLITTGMILLSLGLIAAILAAALPLLAYLATALAFIAFVMLVIGVPIFGRQSNGFSESRGDVNYHKRYGFWLMIPTIILEFFAILAFLGAGLLYRLFGYGNLATSSRNKVYGGQQLLGPPNFLNGPPYGNPPYGIPSYGNPPYGMRPPPMFGAGRVSAPYAYPPIIGESIPSLLSEYLSQRSPEYTRARLIRSSSISVFPQPTIVRAVTGTSVPNVAPAYVRMGEPIPPPPPSSPILNLSGETIIGPIRRIS